MHNDSTEPSTRAAQVVSRGISAAEKKDEYERLGSEWPKYPDGTDYQWQKDPGVTTGGRWIKWPTLVRRREAQRRWAARRRKQPGTCVSPGCGESRHQNSTGNYRTYCQEHSLESLRKYQTAPGGGRHQRREREAQALEAKIQEVLGNHPELKELLNGEED